MYCDSYPNVLSVVSANDKDDIIAATDDRDDIIAADDDRKVSGDWEGVTDCSYEETEIGNFHSKHNLLSS